MTGSKIQYGILSGFKSQYTNTPIIDANPRNVSMKDKEGYPISMEHAEGAQAYYE